MGLPTDNNGKDSAVAEFKDLLNKAKDDPEFGKSADFQKEYEDWYNKYASSDEGKAFLKQKLRDERSTRFVKQYKPFFNAILAGADITTSLNQIAKADKTIGSIIQPAIASSPGVPAELNSQLQKAQSQGGLEAQRAIAPAKAAIDEQYQASKNLASQISGGQGAAYQAAVQSAALQKMRASAGLPAIQDSIMARYQQMANQLATAKGQIGQQDFGNRLYGSQMALQQYNEQLKAAGQLGATGRLNLRNSAQNLANVIPTIAGQILPNRQPAGQPMTQSNNNYSPNYNHPFGEYETKLDQSLKYGGKYNQNLWSNRQAEYLPPSEDELSRPISELE